MSGYPFLTMFVAVCCLVAGVSCHSSSTTVTEVVTDDKGCASAQFVRLDQERLFFDSGRLDHILDAVYYRFEVPASGSWMLFETGNEQMSQFSFNPVISVLSADGSTLRASMNDSLVWSSIDPFFVYHSPIAEQICIKIESYQRWTSSTTSVDSSEYDLGYSFQMTYNPTQHDTYDIAEQASNGSLDENIPLAIFEPADGGEGQFFNWIHGTLYGARDADVFSFTTGGVASLVDVYLNMREGVGVPSAGISGSGSTASVLAEILDASAQVVAAVELDERRISVTTVLDAETTYYLRISGAKGWMPGANDYYSLLLNSEPVETFPFESTTENGSIETAEPIESVFFSEETRVGSVLGNIDGPTDVDVFSVDIMDNQYVLLQCMGANLGSGLNDLTVGFLDATNAVLQSEVEGEAPIEWAEGSTATDDFIFISQAGQYYLRIEGTPADSPLSNLYYCYLIFVDASK